MGVKIHIQADEVWSFFSKNKGRCTKELVKIAENEETQYAAYITEENGYPLLCICKGDADPEYQEGIINDEDCVETVSRCLLKYLFPITEKSDKDIKSHAIEYDDPIVDLDERQALEDISYEREDELLLAVCDFLQVVLQEGNDGADIFDIYGQEMAEEILDHTLKFLTTKYGLEIYRPVFLTNEETGEEIYTEYPYELDGDYINFLNDSAYDYGGGW